MATPLDFGLFKQFEIIFPFIFIVTILFVVFSKWTPLLKESKTLAGVCAFSVAVMTMFSPIAVRSISLAAPWFVLFVLFSTFVLIGFYSLGIKESSVVGVIASDRYSYIVILIVTLFLIIAIGSVSKAVSEQGGIGPEAGSTQESEFYRTIFHPQILGVIFIMLVAFFTIMVVAKKNWDA